MLINKVMLYTSELDEMKQFYVNKLGFTLLEGTDKAFTIAVGISELEIVKTNKDDNPFYHFAFNIPNNQFRDAKAWIKNSVTLNREEGEDEVYFEFLDAYSLYFLDPSHNIVEFIARNSSVSSNKSDFSAQSFINISEINITTNDVMAAGRDLMKSGVPVRNDEVLVNDGLNFLGEYEEGAYFLLGPSGRRWFFSDRNAEIYPLSIKFNDTQNVQVDGEGKVFLS